jgi:hypothetical protein
MPRRGSQLAKRDPSDPSERPTTPPRAGDQRGFL